MLIDIANLRVAAENPRKTPADEAAHLSLVASMKAHGQITNILVRPGDKPGLFDIIDGGRRFQAAKAAELEQLKADLYEGTSDAGEIGAAANMMRAAMHPLDEAKVIARLAANGESLDSIGLRFGKGQRWVEQRQKLDRLSPKAKTLFREARIDMAAAQALTLGTKVQQEQYLAKAKDDWHYDASNIRRCLTAEAINAKYALFPLSDYPAKYIVRDLFSEDVRLTNVELFHEMQRKAAAELAEKVRAEGWSEVIERDDRTSDEFYAKYAEAVGDTIKKAERAKFAATVYYHSRSGEVIVKRGYVLRKDAKKVRKGQSTDADKVDQADVAPATCFDLSPTQDNIIAALQTQGIARAIAGGDTWLALHTMLSPLLPCADNEARNEPAWAGLRRSFPNYIGANTLFDDKLEHPESKPVRFPGRTAFERMSWDDVMGLVRLAALATLQLMYRPDPAAAKELETAGVEWFRYDAAFLRRFRLDALQDLARHLKIESDGLKKGQLVAAILAHEGRPFLPVKWNERRKAEQAG